MALDFASPQFSDTYQIVFPSTVSRRGMSGARSATLLGISGFNTVTRLLDVSFELRYEPEIFGVKSGQHGLTQHSQLVTKAINARNHGAKALVLINGKLADGEEDLLMRFGGVSGPQ